MPEKPASGNTALVGFREEIEEGVPAFGSFFFLRVNTPVQFGLQRVKTDDASLDPSGFQRPMMPSTVRGNAPELSLLLTSRHILEFLYHFFGSVVQNPISGGFEYVFTPDASGPDFGFSVFVSMPPVENYISHTFKVSDIELAIAGANALVVKFTGNLRHGQKYDEASNFTGTGTYVQPSIRGPVKFPELGDIFVQVSSLSPLSYQAEITDGIPTYPGAVDVPVALDTLVSPARGVFQNLQGDVKFTGVFSVTAASTTVTADVPGLINLQDKKYLGTGTTRAGMGLQIGAEAHVLASVTDANTFEIVANHVAGETASDVHMLNRDFGHVGEHKDPVELIFQGDATDFADIVVNDQWEFASTIADRVPAFTGSDRFSSAHSVHFFRTVGSTVWNRFDGTSSTVKVSWPLEIEEGHGTEYLTALDRTGRLSAMLDPFDQVYRLRNRTLVDWAESNEDIESKVEIFGKLLGDGTFREGHSIFFPFSSVTSVNRPISSPDRLQLSTQIVGTTDDAGVAPIIWRVYTERDWTPPTFI